MFRWHPIRYLQATETTSGESGHFDEIKIPSGFQTARFARKSRRRAQLAKAIHAKYLGTAFEDGRKWNDERRSGFKLLRAAGHDHPDMKKIEAMLE